ncbi:hypothetical protein CEXT_577571 [Caerostris extrusa]|uniref:Uncharacterized protein n=1 Tax=Caerostris extrusa TaxID=172846 RepID=A0AAV4Q374_CAEEX|nr:hypothetical protein CEXT_577571 [Caerostris extrusa]
MFILTISKSICIEGSDFCWKENSGMSPREFSCITIFLYLPFSFQQDDVKDHSTRMLLESGARLNAIPFSGTGTPVSLLVLQIFLFAIVPGRYFPGYGLRLLS